MSVREETATLMKEVIHDLDQFLVGGSESKNMEVLYRRAGEYINYDGEYVDYKKMGPEDTIGNIVVLQNIAEDLLKYYAKETATVKTARMLTDTKFRGLEDLQEKLNDRIDQVMKRGSIDEDPLYNDVLFSQREALKSMSERM